VLEPDDRFGAAFGRSPLSDDVADATRGAFAGVFGEEVEDADARKLGARGFAIKAPEELVGATDGEHRCSGFDGVTESIRFRGKQIIDDNALLSVLRTSREDEVTLRRIEAVAETQLGELEADAACFATPAKAH